MRRKVPYQERFYASLFLSSMFIGLSFAIYLLGIATAVVARHGGADPEVLRDLVRPELHSMLRAASPVLGAYFVVSLIHGCRIPTAAFLHRSVLFMPFGACVAVQGALQLSNLR